MVWAVMRLICLDWLVWSTTIYTHVRIHLIDHIREESCQYPEYPSSPRWRKNRDYQARPHWCSHSTCLFQHYETGLEAHWTALVVLLIPPWQEDEHLHEACPKPSRHWTRLPQNMNLIHCSGASLRSKQKRVRYGISKMVAHRTDIRWAWSRQRTRNETLAGLLSLCWESLRKPELLESSARIRDLAGLLLVWLGIVPCFHGVSVGKQM